MEYMNNNKPVAIVLGGTHPHIALIKNLKNRGYYTVLVDYLENPPAKFFADEHIRESTFDKEALLEISRKAKASLVINLFLDQPVQTAAYVSEKLNLPAYMSYETAQKVTNKGFMKKRMYENKIPTAKYCIINNLDDAEEISLKYPLIAKPVAENASIAIKRIYCYDELINYLNDYANGVTNGGIIIEELYKGIEIQIDCFVKDKTAHILLIRQKEIVPINKYEKLLLGSFSPAQISHKAEKKIDGIAQKIVKAYELDNTPMHFQAFVDGDTVNVIEIAGRLPGVISYKIIKNATGFDILDYSVDTLLRKEGSLYYHKPRYIYSIVIVHAQPSVFGKITGLEDLVGQKIIDDFILQRNEGMVIPAGLSKRNRVASLLISAESTKQIQEKIDDAFQKMDVLDSNGNSVMIRNLKLTV